MSRQIFYLLTTLFALLVLNLEIVNAQVIGTGSNPNEVGEYIPTENVIINNAPGTTGNNTNSIDGEFNFVGGDRTSVGLNGNLRNSFSYGLNNDLRAGSLGLAIGLGLELNLNARSSYAIGETITINNENAFGIGEGHVIDGPASFAIGEDLDLNNPDNYGFGRLIDISNDQALAIGFGDQSSSNRLQDAGQNSITIGVDAQNVFNILLNSNNNPVTGIGTTSPGTDKLRIVGNTTGPEAALNVQNSNNVNRFNVRNDGVVGFNIPPITVRARAPYQFEETEFSPFNNGQGEANIVQNYNGFPSIESGSKWLALGERPPGNGSTQVAYGLANVWEDNAANLILLDQSPKNTNQSPTKDAALTFQDASKNGSKLKSDKGENRFRFLFRNGKKIEKSSSTFELMSLEPTGEVAVGDYSDNSLDPEATRFEVKWNENTDCANADCDPNDGNNTYDPETIMEVLRDGSATSRGNEVLTVNDAGFVGINIAEPEVEFDVDGTGEINNQTITSDKKFKKDLELIQDPLQKLKEIRGLTYSYKNQKYPEQNFGKGRWSGVIAQDVKEVLPEAVRKYGDHYSVNYDGIIPLLIETNKAQQEKMENQAERIKKLETKAEKVEKLQKQVKALQEEVNGLAKDDAKPANSFKNDGDENLNKRTIAIGNEDGQQQAMLLQNRPNPYSNETIIPYFLPRDFERASLMITNTNGQLVKRIRLKQSGKGELTLQTESLNAGQYIYSLIVDGREIQTRKMVVKK